MLVEGADQKSSTEVTLTNETNSKSPEELEPTVQNIPDTAEKNLTDQLLGSQEAMIIEKVDQKLSPEQTLPNGTRLESTEMLEPAVHNNPDRADTFLADQLSEHTEETSVEKVDQKTSAKETLPTETRQESPEIMVQAAHNLSDKAEINLAVQLSGGPEKLSVEKVGQESSTKLTLTNEMMLKSTEKLEEAVQNIPDKAEPFLVDQLSEDPEAMAVEGVDQKSPTEVTLTNETKSKSPEELQPTVQNISEK